MNFIRIILSINANLLKNGMVLFLLLCLTIQDISAQICPNFTIENKYDYVNVSFLFNNQSAEELFKKKNAGNRFEDLNYTITFDFENDKIFWTSSDFQGVNTNVHDIIGAQLNDDFMIIDCTMFHPAHQQEVIETMKLDMSNKTCLYFYKQSEEYLDPGLKEAGIHAVVTAAEYFEFK